MNDDTPTAAILRRVFQPTRPFDSKTTAKEILAFEFDAEDEEVMRGLAEKARAGRLTPDDERMIEFYTRVASLLSIVKLKARLTLAKKPVRRKAAKSA